MDILTFTLRFVEEAKRLLSPADAELFESAPGGLAKLAEEVYPESFERDETPEQLAQENLFVQMVD